MFYATCEQQRRRSVCADAQSDQRICYSLLRYISIIPILALSKVLRLKLVPVHEQDSLLVAVPEDTVFHDLAQLDLVSFRDFLFMPPIRLVHLMPINVLVIQVIYALLG